MGKVNLPRDALWFVLDNQYTATPKVLRFFSLSPPLPLHVAFAQLDERLLSKS